MAFFPLACAFLLLFLNARTILALNPPQYCFYGCNSATYAISFEGSPNICVNELAYKTNYYCAAVYCSDTEIDAGLSLFNKDCEYALPSFNSVVDTIDLDRVPTISLDEAAASIKAPLDHVVIPDRYFFDVGYRTTVSRILVAGITAIAESFQGSILQQLPFWLLLLVSARGSTMCQWFQ